MAMGMSTMTTFATEKFFFKFQGADFRTDGMFISASAVTATATADDKRIGAVDNLRFADFNVVVVVVMWCGAGVDDDGAAGVVVVVVVFDDFGVSYDFLDDGRGRNDDWSWRRRWWCNDDGGWWWRCGNGEDFLGSALFVDGACVRAGGGDVGNWLDCVSNLCGF